MKVSDIQFEDESFKEAILSLGIEDSSNIIEIRARKRSIRKVNGLEYFPNLKLLDLTRNLITEIDTSKNPLLEELYLGSNEIEELDLSNNTQLTHLEIFNNDISELDLSHLSRLENLYANKNDLVSVDLSNNPDIEEIQLSDNDLEALTLAQECKPFIVKAENTKLADAAREHLKTLVSEHNLKI